MNLLKNESNTRVGLTFSLPPDFHAPVGGAQETVIDIQMINNPLQPIEIGSWRYASIVEGEWTFWFAHPYANIGIQYRVHIQLFHDNRPLLLRQHYSVIVNNTPHRETLHLSPLGHLYVSVQQPRDIPAEEAVTVCLHEAGQPEAELVRVTQDEHRATSFYLKYDPDKILPGKYYSLTSTDNKYNHTLSVSPGLVQLLPE
ncbi:hypothetical protein HU762_07645 [Pseudomonas sp. SWRI92]|uniref:hypothetical protein n=1 Tax=Pseudomonas sp. SWRI92 TaxID=2745499 RepID=UPI0016460ACF|nr:hypothetical protein [Pseudomonas sp. SWRI92]MBC3373815.1 hypothetical protein [Pseudomonas sp. SWRI92]